MKRILQMAVLALMLLAASSQNKVSAQYSDEEVSYQTFYDNLSPYGQWIDYPEYGYVWSPNEGPDFRPYSSNGHWVYSDDYEWMWVSDYEWGWAPFHYGRWFSDPAYGWLWVPGYEWAPAWVAWRTGNEYYGWAPLRPGINISVGFSLGNYYAPDDYWCFTPSRYITSPRVYDYCIDRRQNINFISTTIIINNYNRSRNAFVTGPRRSDAEIYCGRINPVQFRQSSRPGRAEFRRNEVAIYRPNVQRDDNRRATPRNFDRYDRQAPNRDNRVAGNNNRQDRNNNDFRNNDRTNNTPRVNGNNDNRAQQPINNNGQNNGGFRNNRGDNRNSNNLPTRNDDVRTPRQPQQAPVRNNNETRMPQQAPVRDNRETRTPQQAPVRNNNDFRNQRQTEQPPVANPNNDNRFNQRRNRDDNPGFRNNNAPIRQIQPQTVPDQRPTRQVQQQPTRQVQQPVRQVQQPPRQAPQPQRQITQPQRQTTQPARQEQPRSFERRDNNNTNRDKPNNGRRRN